MENGAGEQGKQGGQIGGSYMRAWVGFGLRVALEMEIGGLEMEFGVRIIRA